MDVSQESHELKSGQQQGCNEEPTVTSQPPSTLQPTNLPANPPCYDQLPPVMQQPTSQPPGTLQPTNFPASPQGYYQPPPLMQQPMYQSHSNTTVVVTQQQAPRVVSPRVWTSGLCGCFDDFGMCLCVVCCCSCASVWARTDTGENSCTPTCVPNWLTALRAKVRTQLGIQGSICNDCLVDTFCHCCALCQLKREVKFAKQNGLM
ncbi:hypothetical protein V1264_009278 [Littorina saxatilis]|uniref:Uncharacterized protein n=1 Tax=Littorina saxatilis TaxID=31220 RepID=A0AAN9ARD0_9CAEN